ncbi:MAG: T9SS type A sorting domain-containing protein [Bacteroidales bacterium]
MTRIILLLSLFSLIFNVSIYSQAEYSPFGEGTSAFISNDESVAHNSQLVSKTSTVYFEDFETYDNELDPEKWEILRSTDLSGADLATADSPKWFLCTPSSFFGQGSTYIHSGSRSAAISSQAPNLTWLASMDTVSIPDETMSLYFWLYFQNVPSQDLYTHFHVMIMDVEQETWEVLDSWDDTNENNLYQDLVTIELDGYEEKDVRIAFVYENIDDNGVQAAIDNVLIGMLDSPDLKVSAYHLPFSKVPEILANSMNYEINAQVYNFGLEYNDNSSAVKVSIPSLDDFESELDIQDVIETGESKFYTLPDVPSFTDEGSYSINYSMVDSDTGEKKDKESTDSFTFTISSNIIATDYADEYGVAGGFSAGKNVAFGNIYPIHNEVVADAIEIYWPEFDEPSTFNVEIYEISPLDSTLSLKYEQELYQEISHSQTVTSYSIDQTYLEPGANYFIAVKQLTDTPLHVGFDQVKNGQFWRLNSEDELELLSSSSIGNIALRLKVIEPTENPTFTLVVNDGDAPIEDATVSINDEDMQTDQDGMVSFEIPNGYYEYTVEKDGFAPISEHINIQNANIERTITLSPEYDITFIVKSEDETLLEDAEILTNSNSFFTNEDGEVIIPLPEGNNSYTAMLDGYSPVSNTLNVTGSNTEEIELTTEETFSVTFELVSRHNEEPLGTVKVLLDDYGTKLTNNDGEVIFNGVPQSASGYSYEVSKNGYLSTSGTTSPVTQANDPVIVLDTLDIITYNVVIQVTDGSEAIEEAEVTLANDSKLTNSDGFVLFEDIIPNNELSLTATKEGFEVSDTIIGVYNANVRKTIALEAETTAPSLNEESITVFPNPTSGVIKMNAEMPFRFHVFDMTGRLMLSESTHKQNHSIDISNYSAGIYFVKIISDSITTTKRIIKQ